MSVHAFRAAGTTTQPTRLVLASFADVDAAMADGEWLSIDADHVREVEP